MLKCTKCMAPLKGELFNTPEMSRCPSCGVLIKADVFPALFRELPTGNSGETLLMDDEAACFYHPGKKAVVPCSVCGRFLCALCDIDFNGRHICPSCLETGKKKRKIRNLENHRMLYDNMALYLAVIPMMFIFPTILTAPAVLFITLRYWKAPASLIPRTKIRFITAFFLAGCQLLGWAVFFYSLATR
ncbi:hypothetical protein [Desulfonema magnum]|uniref:B box-type domain-containing protein n=1 Tax=Desulfonema magnum TaxID=45655 RepID=A0A975GMM3_9BACT|nr:hypothetical protein [Desulfonema magnum]QTA86849.1 Uncharacterized protein dnm_028730 [Desulfonema magnum]